MRSLGADAETPTPRRGLNAVAVYLEMIKVAHTVFALPFAVGAAFLASRDLPGHLPPLAVLGKIVLAVLCARTAAMSFNRLVDRRLDAGNPRTAGRALPRGLLSARAVAASTVLALAGFFATAWWINELAFQLSPVAAAVYLGYSLTKRFTWLCHLVLGSALAMAPLGAWVAVTGRLDPAPWWLALAVLLWTTGFDILYATLDADHDRSVGLHSVPAWLGIRGALRVAALLHLAMVAALGVFSVVADLGWVFRGTLLAVGLLLVYEHGIVRPDDLSRTNRAFFATNGVISFLVMGALIVESVRA